MTPEQVAHDTASLIATFPVGFLVDGATSANADRLGLDLGTFYVAGRGGVLGDVPADVVVAAFTFFAPDWIRAAWERSAAVPRHAAAEAYVDAAHAWATATFDDALDWSRLAALLEPVVANASVACAPVFAGYRATLAEPHEPKALAQHRLNAVRELRGGLHAAATLTVGLTPFEASSVRTPQLLAFQGWSGTPLDPAPLRDRWNLAEARTDRMLGRAFAVLSDTERTELVELLVAIRR
jgi:hypothetical protein